MAYPEAMKEFGINNTITTNDIRKDSPAEYHSDYIKAFNIE
jgi:hypothetical protein